MFKLDSWPISYLDTGTYLSHFRRSFYSVLPEDARLNTDDLPQSTAVQQVTHERRSFQGEFARPRYRCS